MSLRRLQAVLVAVALIVGAAALFRLSSEPENFQVLRAPMGQVVPFNDGAAAVQEVQVGTSVREGAETATTSGVFVLVRMLVQAPGKRTVSIQQIELLSPGRTYHPYTDVGVITADPGFRATRDVVFEVDPADLAGLTVQAYDNSFVVGYHQRLRTHLGITAGNADAWLEAAQDQRLTVVDRTDTRGLS